MWAFFPLAAPAAIAAGGAVAGWVLGRAASSTWMPALATWLLAIAALLVWTRMIQPYQPRLPGRGPFGLPPIAHVPATKGPIVDYLQQEIGLRPGADSAAMPAPFSAPRTGWPAACCPECTAQTGKA